MSWEYILPEDDYRLYRENISLLEEQVVNHFPDIYKAPEILSAIRKVPRHLFVNESYKYLAYTDNALPTYRGLTTSAPSVIAEMIYNVGISGGEKLLEIGTGMGYEAAVLSEMGVRVFTIEIDGGLALKANRVLVLLGYKVDRTLISETEKRKNVVRYGKIRKFSPHRGTIDLFMGNGQRGLKKYSPFKGIILAASVFSYKDIACLTSQLSENGGKLVVPVGGRHEQYLYTFERREGKMNVSVLKGVTFDFVRLVVSSEVE
ncbi:MAG: hypothetical protein DRP87_02130 [Spirochaetes bacterium]|nr:MAG: hypothetical protein DRP87_02130 [Spirochaetota bacterium]